MKTTFPFVLLLAGLITAGCANGKEAVDEAQARRSLELGVKLEALRDREKAREHYEIAAEHPATREAALTNLGNVHAALGDTEAAERFYRQSLAARETPESLNNLAWMFVVHHRDLEEAAALAGRAVELARRAEVRAACAHTAGTAYSLMGDSEKAIRYYESAAVDGARTEAGVTEDVAFGLARELMLCERLDRAADVLAEYRRQNELAPGHRIALLEAAVLRRQREGRSGQSSDKELEDGSPQRP